MRAHSRVNRPPAGSFGPAAAKRGDELFSGKAKCSTGHVEPLWTEPWWNLHTPSEIGIDAFQADRAGSPLSNGAARRLVDAQQSVAKRDRFAFGQSGGFYHDARIPRLRDVINHYNDLFHLGLSDAEKRDLAE